MYFASEVRDSNRLRNNRLLRPTRFHGFEQKAIERRMPPSRLTVSTYASEVNMNGGSAEKLCTKNQFD